MNAGTDRLVAAGLSLAAVQIVCLDLDGQMTQRIHWSGEPVEVSETDRDRYVAKSLENVGDNPTSRRWLAETVWATEMPVLNALAADPAGNLWAERHAGVTHSDPLRLPDDTGFDPSESDWEVFSPDGRWLGSVALIPGMAPHQIGEDWILLVGEDADGVARVALYGLTKPGH